MLASCAAVTGGTPWQEPQNTLPVSVHFGVDVPWHHALAHVPVVRFQPSPVVTSAGSGVSMWPAAFVVAGTR